MRWLPPDRSGFYAAKRFRGPSRPGFEVRKTAREITELHDLAVGLLNPHSRIDQVRQGVDSAVIFIGHVDKG